VNLFDGLVAGDVSRGGMVCPCLAHALVLKGGFVQVQDGEEYRG